MRNDIRSVYNHILPQNVVFQQAAQSSGYGSAIVLPVISSRGEIISIISLFSVEPEYFTQEKINTFRTFASQIEAIIEIRNLIDGLETAVQNRTVQLTCANERLKELDRMKSMFIASTSHELRTPLNSVIGFSSMLLMGLSGDLNPEQKEQLEIIHSSGKHLLALISDIIDLSKMEAGKINVVVSQFYLGHVVDEAVLMLRTSLDEKKLDLKVDVEDIAMKSDRTRLLQCIMNLLGNAVKFTEKGSVGITAKTSGTGLGLYLVKKLSRDFLGGDVGAVSEFGKGSTFTMRIPVDIQEIKVVS